MPASKTAAAGRPAASDEPTFLSRLPAGLLDQIRAAGRVRRVPATREILRQDDRTTEACILLSGHARVLFHAANGRVVDFRNMTAGSIFGEWSAIDRRPRSASVEAVTDCDVLLISAERMGSLIEAEPGFARALIVHLVGQLRRLTAQAAEFSTLAVNNRIDAELLRLAGDQTDAPITLKHATHAELALRVSTSREAVTRRVNQQVRAGILEKRGRALILKNRSALARLVEAQQVD
jgi:CRP-like cAMP-binding protein